MFTSTIFTPSTSASKSIPNSLTAKRSTGSLVLVIALFWQIGASAGTLNNPRVPAALLQAEQALQRQDPTRALHLLEARVDSFRRPIDRAHAHGLICRAHYQQEDFVNAEKSCDTAANTGRPNWSHFNNLGVMRFKLGHYTAALQDFRRAAATKLSASKAEIYTIRSNVAAAERQLAARVVVSGNE